jgi:hypothetical protein
MLEKMHRADRHDVRGQWLRWTALIALFAVMALRPSLTVGSTADGGMKGASQERVLMADAHTGALLPHQGQVSAPTVHERNITRTRLTFPAHGPALFTTGTTAPNGSPADTPPPAGRGLTGIDIIYPFHSFW